MIAHLQGREDALEAFGWTGRQAEWIALACLHSGVFIRAQLSAYLRIDRWQALRFVRAMSERRLAADETLEGRKVCRICGRGIYRALGAEDIRHRRTASDEVLLRRLLALEAERALFVYVDPGHDTATALRSWAVAHRDLWEAPRERGRSIEVVAVVRTVRELQRALTILENWTNTSTASGPSAAPEPDSAAHREIVRIEQAIRAKDERVLKEYGDLQACLKRIVELNDLHRSSTPGTLIHGFATWRSRRLPGGGF